MRFLGQRREMLMLAGLVALLSTGLLAADKPIATVTFVCASTRTFSAADLGQALRNSHLQLPPGPGVWGDRSAAVNLDSDPGQEHLVPLTCGATGNCTWVVIDDDRSLLEGTVEGCVIKAFRTRERWAELHTLVRYSASEGRLFIYAYGDNRYREMESGTMKTRAVVEFGKCLDDVECCDQGQQSD